MFNITKNETLLNLVGGKKIAVVRPAPYLQGTNFGSFIDKYDIVCRINEIIPPPSIRNDYGSRVDIFFSNFGTPHVEGIKKKINTYTDFYENLKMVICPTIKAKHADTNFLQWKDDHISDVYKNMKELNYNNIPSHWIGVRDYKKLYGLIGAEPNAGVLAIMMLLSHEISELYLTGFSFNLGGATYDDVYYRGHLDASFLVPSRVFGPYGGHGIDANLKQIQFFKWLCQNNPSESVIRIDSFLRDLISIDNISSKVIINE